jgi:hypothetical protein
MFIAKLLGNINIYLMHKMRSFEICKQAVYVVTTMFYIFQTLRDFLEMDLTSNINSVP